MQDIVLVHDDYLNYIDSVADHSVDLVVVDPPYEVSVRHDGGRLYANKGITKSNLKLSDADLDLGFDVDKFIASMLRVMKGINIYIWCSKKQIPKYFDIFVNSLGCKFDILCWHKSNALPTYNNKYLTDTEYLLYFQDGGKNHPQSYADAQTFWVQPINSKDAKKWGHPTIKPLNIIEAIIRNSSKPGDLVLDCFMGSGTTGVACKQLGRSFIGVEINEQFYNIAKSRIDGSCCDNTFEIFGLF